MNPLVQTRPEHIQDQIDQLRTVLAANDGELRKQHGEKADLLQEQWNQRKEVTTKGTATVQLPSKEVA